MECSDIVLSREKNIDNNLLIVFGSVVEEFEKMFDECPLGDRPVVIKYNKDYPMVDAVSDTNKYLIFLTVQNNGYDQFVYQLSHELCHIFIDPRRSNWFIESCCDLMSLFILDKMAKKWLTNPPFFNWKDYASNFEKYARNMEQKAIQEIFHQKKIPNNKKLKKWLINEKILLKEEPKNRSRNRIVGLMLRPILERSLDNWKIFNFLGQATNNPPKYLQDLNINTNFDFEYWIKAVPKDKKKLIREIKLLFPKIE